MNWNKILNLLILIFLFINILLAGISYIMKENKYTLSTERETQLREILYEKGITVYNYLPDNYPKKKLIVEAPKINKDILLNRIFDEGYSNIASGNTSKDSIQNRYVSDQHEIVFYSGNFEGIISYKGQNNKYIPKQFTKDEVIASAKKLAEDMMFSVSKLELTDIKPYFDQELYVLEFNERYKEQLLFCNYLSIRISSDGMIEAIAKRYTPVEFVGAEIQLYPIDEVLYKFMENIEFETDQLVRITDIDLGYDLGLDEQVENVLAETVPYYKITLNEKDVYYIDAYTNTIKKSEF